MEEKEAAVADDWMECRKCVGVCVFVTTVIADDCKKRRSKVKKRKRSLTRRSFLKCFSPK